MAELILRADIPSISVTDSIDMTASMILSKSENATFSPPEKIFTAIERLPPWHHMHHAGYWFRLSAKSAKRRLRYAKDIPEEDRAEPQRSPASAVAQRSRTYDTYLCPAPHEEYSDPDHEGFDHGADIINKLQLSSIEFNDRKQKRFVERLRLEVGRELLRKCSYQEGLDHLRDLWHNCSWRQEKWWLPLFELNRVLAECARQVGDIQVLASVLFELYAPQLRLLRDMKIDLMDCGKSITVVPEQEAVPNIELGHGSIVSFC
jgi:solute carrier family 25 protein 38